MAQDDKPTAVDKGKSKAVENGKPEDVPKDKDGKPTANGNKEDEKDECMRRGPRLRVRELTAQLQPQKSSVRRTSNSRASLTCLSSACRSDATQTHVSTTSSHTDWTATGIRCISLQAGLGIHEELHQDIHIVHDRRT